MKNNNFILNLIFLISFLFSSNDNQEYVVLVSFDGFRHDYVDRFELPYFEYIEKWGVKANSLNPSKLDFATVPTASIPGTNG